MFDVSSVSTPLKLFRVTKTLPNSMRVKPDRSHSEGETEFRSVAFMYTPVSISIRVVCLFEVNWKLEID